MFRQTRISFLSLLLLAGCVEPISMIPDDEDLPVAVHCVLVADEHKHAMVQSMSLHYIKRKYETDYIPVEEGEAQIVYSPTGSPHDERIIPFHYVGNGIWETEQAETILPNTKYNLAVKIPGRKTMKSSTFCPELFMSGGIDKAQDYNSTYEVYRIRDYTNYLESDSFALWVTGQEYFDGEWRDLEYVASNHPGTDEFNGCELRLSDMSMLGEPMENDQEDERLTSLFSLYQKNAPDLPLHKGFLRIGRMDYLDPFFLFAGPIHYSHAGTREDNPYDVLHPYWFYFIKYQYHWLNEDLDKYYRSVYVNTLRRDSFLTEIYSTPDAYTNITNGIGIFGIEFTSSGGPIDPIFLSDSTPNIHG